MTFSWWGCPVPAMSHMRACTQEHGANPKLENREKKTPERMAKSKEVKDILKKARDTSVPGTSPPKEIGTTVGLFVVVRAVFEVDKDMLAEAGDFDG